MPDEPLATDSEPVGLANVERVSVVNDSAARGLHELAEERRAVAIVVGSTGRGTVGRVAPEAWADDSWVARHAPWRSRRSARSAGWASAPLVLPLTASPRAFTP
jgi:hypothetical protein